MKRSILTFTGRRTSNCFFFFLLFFFAGRVAHADITYTVAIDTAPLIGDSAGPFAVNFQFIDGSGLGDGNNTVELSDFQFGSGSPIGGATTSGAVSGGLSSQIILTDSTFFNYFTQLFQPGDTLTFNLSATTNVDAGSIPDQFSFAILDSTGSELPTTDPLGAFVELSISSLSPEPLAYASNPTLAPVGGGGPIDVPAPEVTPSSASPVPEPGTLTLLAAALATLALMKKLRAS
jgi:hypothetical protein